MIDNLQKMSRDELVVLAMKQGLPKPHHKAKPESIIKIIMDSIAHPAKELNDNKSVQAPKAAPLFASKEEVEEAIADIKARVPEFQSIYDDEAHCVTFRCRGAEDCISLSVPVRPRPQYPMGMCIYNKAKMVSRGKLALRGHSERDFDHMNAGGKNAYTNVVLA